MYTNPQSGQADAATSAPTLHVGTFRRNILAVVVGNPLFTDAEQLRCNDSVYQCQDAYRLAVWLRNVRRVATEREEAAALAELVAKAEQSAREAIALTAQREEVARLAGLPCFTAGERQHALGRLPQLTPAWAVREVGSLYATALRRSSVKLYTDGSTRFAN